ncbi:MAG: HD domain-containing protein [bacterium]|nr:HD domain-containing protein [bacterium]
MKLRNKFFIVFSAGIIIFIIISLSIQYFFIVPATLKIEKSEAGRSLQRSIDAIRNEEEHLAALTKDWGEWDDTFNFINNNNKEFIKSNLNLTTFKNANLYAILFYTSGKTLAWAGKYNKGDSNYSKFTDIYKTFALNFKNMIGKNKPISGLISTNKGIYMIALNPILNSSGKGVSKGTIFMVKKFNNGLIKEIRNRVSLDITFKKMHEIKKITNKPFFVLDKERDILSSNIYLTTLNQGNCILLHADISRGIFSRSLRILNYAQLFVCFVALMLLLIVLLIVRKMVTQPLSNLIEYIIALKNKHRLNNISNIKRKDEIGILAREFDTLLAKFNTINQDLEHLVDERTSEIKNAHGEMIFRLVIAADKRDFGTGNHIKRINQMTILFADKLGMPEDISNMYGLASTMHDIGKIGISDSILLKPGKLTTEEYEKMKEHCAIGGSILEGSKIRLLNIAREIALGHHERWDGKGYPMQLKGKDIPISARVVAILDVFDALYSERLYKKAWNIDEILSHFKENRGKQFDPELTDLFLCNISEFKEIVDKYNS